MKSSKYNGNGSSWGASSNPETLETPISNWFGAPTIPTQNVFSSVNVNEISGLFNSTLRFIVPSSVKLMTITGSEVFISNDVFELMNISLVLSIKEQIEKSIFKHENNAVLDVAYTPQINVPNVLTENYYTTYGSMPNNDARVVNAMIQAASRLVSIFKDLGIDLTSDSVTKIGIGIRIRDIFMSAYVLCMQIIIMYNMNHAGMKQPVKDHAVSDKRFAMPVSSDTNIEAEHKSVFDGVKPDENGMFNIEFGNDSDQFTDMIEKARNFSLNNKEDK